MTDSERMIYVFASAFLVFSGGMAAAFKAGFDPRTIHGGVVFPLLVLAAAGGMVTLAVYLASLARQEGVRWAARILGMLPIVVVLGAIGYFAYGIAST